MLYSVLLSLQLLFSPAILTPMSEIDCMAQIIYFEARGEPVLGQIAVAQVVNNRIESADFPDTVCKVIQQTKPVCQFSWYCDDNSDILPSNKEHYLAKTIAIMLIVIPIKDVTKGSLYFNSSNKLRSEPHIAIGNHVFFRRS